MSVGGLTVEIVFQSVSVLCDNVELSGSVQPLSLLWDSDESSESVGVFGSVESLTVQSLPVFIGAVELLTLQSLSVLFAAVERDAVELCTPLTELSVDDPL